ncbi:MAG: metal-dependent hydrolase [Rhodospirillales bacterium]|nr:metal-dependent hydrolase [Rhodospirillales bacterium]
MFIRKIMGAVSALAFLLVAGIGSPQAAEIQWFGQSALKITTPGGKVIMVDPFITKNPKTPKELKDLSKLGKVDLVMITHGHGDHVGDSVAIAKANNAKIVLNADMGRTFATIGWIGMKQLVRINKSGPVTPLGPGITITMVHAEHSSEVSYKNDGGKDTMGPGGEPAGYILKLEDGYTIYLAGDTGVFGDMKFIAEYYKPDVAFLPIGGWFTMDPVHAAYAVKNLLKTKTVVPIHYGTFGALKGTPAEFKAALGNFPTNVVDMKLGETRTFK